jgi:hypothetical protein
VAVVGYLSYWLLVAGRGFSSTVVVGSVRVVDGEPGAVVVLGK